MDPFITRGMGELPGCKQLRKGIEITGDGVSILRTCKKLVRSVQVEDKPRKRKIQKEASKKKRDRKFSVFYLEVLLFTQHGAFLNRSLQVLPVDLWSQIFHKRWKSSRSYFVIKAAQRLVCHLEENNSESQNCQPMLIYTFEPCLDQVHYNNYHFIKVLAYLAAQC